jgi:hypothetical protein
MTTAPCVTVKTWPATITVPVRASPLFSAIVNVTGPLLLPLFPNDTTIHPDCDTAVQLQPVSVSTASATVPATADTDVFGGAMAKRHGAASCATETAMSFTVTMPCRADGAAFAATRYPIDPAPCPLLSDESAIHVVAVVAAQVQSRVVVTVSIPGAPAAGIEVIELLTFTSHFEEDEGPVTDIDEPVHPEASAAENVASRTYSRARIRATRTVQAVCPIWSGRPISPLVAQPFGWAARGRVRLQG